LRASRGFELPLYTRRYPKLCPQLADNVATGTDASNGFCNAVLTARQLFPAFSDKVRFSPTESVENANAMQRPSTAHSDIESKTKSCLTV